MISKLAIENIGGIASAQIDLSGNFVVITGESGSGKSSVVRALELCASSKRNKSKQANLIKAGECEAAVELCIKGTQIKRLLGAKANKAYIDKKPVTISELASFMDKKIQIQSQNAQIDLLNQTMELLDIYGAKEINDIKKSFSNSYAAAVELGRRSKELKEKKRAILEKFDGLDEIRERISHIKLDTIANNCIETWGAQKEEKEKELKRKSALLEAVFKLSTEGGIISSLSSCLETMAENSNLEDQSDAQKLYKCAINDIEELLELVQTKEIKNFNIEEEENALEELEKNIGALRGVLRALGLKNEPQLLEHLKEAEEGKKWLRDNAEAEKLLDKDLQEAKKEISAQALLLREARIASGARLTNEIARHMQDMAINNLRLKISVTPLEKIRSNGADAAYFHITDDKSLPIKPSGGELSRILLAVQCAIGDEYCPWTLVFDEVEAGLGGKIALLAGEKLKEISLHAQVILITHEATLAAIADRHFAVTKADKNGGQTLIAEVTGQSRREEIARMLSGGEALPQALEHARSLLDRE